jgi:hypothetical protein
MLEHNGQDVFMKLEIKVNVVHVGLLLVVKFFQIDSVLLQKVK